MRVKCDLLEHSLDTEGAAVGGVEASLGDEVSLEDEELELVAVWMSFLGVSDVCVLKVDGSRERL